MNFYCDSGGVIFHVDPERIFQGSAGVNKIRFVGQFPSNAQVLVSYKLPNGIWTVPKYMTFVSALEEVQAPNGGIFCVWESLLGATPKVDENGAPVLVDGVQQYELDYTITQNAGTVNVQFFVYAPAEQSNVQNGVRLATEISSITVEKGVPVVVPEYSETDDYEVLLQQILNALTGIVSEYQDLSERLTTAENNIGVLQEDTANLRTELDELTDTVDNLDADLTTAEENIATLQGKSIEQQNQINVLSESTANITNDLLPIKRNISDLQDDVSGITTDVQNIREALDLAEITETVEVTDKYNSRQTENGLTLYPGQPTTLLKVEGDTIATINKFNASAISNSNITVADEGRTITLVVTGAGASPSNYGIGKLQDLCPTLHIGDTVYLYGTGAINGLCNSLFNNLLPFNSSTPTVLTDEILNTDLFINCGVVTSSTTITDLQITKVQNAPWTPYFEGLKSAEFAGIESKNAEETKTSTFDFPNTVNPLGQTIDFENKKIVDYSIELSIDGAVSWTYVVSGGKPSAYCYGLMPYNESSAYPAVATDGITSINTVGWWIIGSGNRTLIWKDCFEYLGLNESWANKTSPTNEEIAAAISALQNFFATRVSNNNPVKLRYISSVLQSETPFTEAQTAAGDSYLPYTGGTETIDNANAEYGVENTVTQEYDIVNKIGG